MEIITSMKDLTIEVVNQVMLLVIPMLTEVSTLMMITKGLALPNCSLLLVITVTKVSTLMTLTTMTYVALPNCSLVEEEVLAAVFMAQVLQTVHQLQLLCSMLKQMSMLEQCLRVVM